MMTDRRLRKLILQSVPFETERLVLRYITHEDASDMYEYSSIPEVCEYLLWSPHINISATEGYIEFLEKRYLRGLYADWAVALKDSNKMIGTCGFANIDSSSDKCEIGYVLSPYFRKKGYMTEALTALLKLSFETLGFETVVLRIINENEASKRLAERVGFILDDIVYSSMEIKGKYRDIAHYVMTKDEYKRIKKEAVV